jgi:hypothetical protein
MRAAIAGSGAQNLPQVSAAVDHSVPVVSFGSGVDTIVVRRIPRTLSAAPSPGVPQGAHSSTNPNQSKEQRHGS